MSRQVNQVKLGAEFIADTPHRQSNDRCLWRARLRRDKVAVSMPEWEQMRLLASETKEHILANLDRYLQEFEENLKKLGVHVHRAADAEEHNRIIYGIFRQHGVKSVTKGKSMTMDECEMRQYLEKHGIEINESDLGERIQQLDNQRDSHIVMPAIHKLREDVAKIFADKLGSDPDNSDPHYLNSVMRSDMRGRYVKADAGMSGVNYALADSGTLAICSNEGDIDISVEVPPLYVVSMGMEKVIPSKKELALFVRLLSRSSLGYDITQYTTHIRGPRKGQEMHVVILDNGRSKRLQEVYWPILKCIRCGACMNTCPVFRRTSGISYDAPYMGPLGICLEPSYDLHRYAQLPYSCTHCGSCGDVCPVRIPLPQLIFYWREVVVKQKESLLLHDAEMGAASIVLKSASNLQMAEKAGLFFLRNTPEKLAQSKINPWAAWHDDPVAPPQTFREWYKKNVGPLATEKRKAPGQESARKDETGLTSDIEAMPNPATVNKQKTDVKSLPDIPKFEIPGDMIQNFVSHLKGFDGTPLLFGNRQEAVSWLSEKLNGQNRKVVSVIEDFKGNLKLSDFGSEAAMHIVDVFVGEADLGVGETGSLLVTTAGLGSPAAALFSTDLYLLIDRAKIVDGIQTAYELTDMEANRYTAFFTGPSATADIEAVHITGAQGEISLTALIYNCSQADKVKAGAILAELPDGTPLSQSDAPLLPLERYPDVETGCDSI